MLFTLLRLRFLSILQPNTKKKRSSAFMIFMAVVYIYLFFMVGSLFYLLFSTICKPFAAMNLSWFYFTLAGLIGFIFSLVGTVFFAQAQLYNARDNELLLSMPITPGTILISRMVFLWLMDFAMNLPVLFPAALAYHQILGLNPAAMFCQIILALLLPCLSLALSTLAAWGVSALTRRLSRYKTLMTMVLSIAFLGLYLYGTSQMQSLLTMLLANASAMAGVARAAFPLYHLGLSALGNLTSLAFTALLCLVPLVLVWLLLKKTFLSFALASKTGPRRRATKGDLRASSLSHALLKRELQRLGSSAAYMMNAGTGILMLVLITVLAWLQRSSFAPLMETIPLSPAAIAALAAALMASMTLFTAPSVSLEGKTLWIIQSLPVPPVAVLAAKVRMHLLISLPPVAVCTLLCAIALGATPFTGLAAIILPAALTWFTACLGLTMNLLFPRFDWINETACVKQGASIILTMLISMMAVFGALGLLIALQHHLPEIAALAVTAALFALLSLGLRIWLRHQGAKRFAAL